MSNMENLSKKLESTHIKKPKRQFEFNINQFTHIVITKGSYKGLIAEIRQVLSKTGRLEVILETNGKTIFVNPDQYLLIKNRQLYGIVPNETNLVSAEKVKMTFAQEFKIHNFDDSAPAESSESESEINDIFESEEPDYQMGFAQLGQVAGPLRELTKEEQRLNDYLEVFFGIFDVSQFLSVDEIMQAMAEIQKELNMQIKNKNEEKLLVAGTIYFILNMNQQRDPLIGKDSKQYEDILLENKFITKKGNLIKLLKALVGKGLGVLPEINEPRRRLQSELEILRPQDFPKNEPSKNYKTRKYLTLNTVRPKQRRLSVSSQAELKQKRANDLYKEVVIANVLAKGKVFHNNKAINDFILNNIGNLVKYTSKELKLMQNDSNRKQIETLIKVNDQLDKMVMKINEANLIRSKGSPKRKYSDMDIDTDTSRVEEFRDKKRKERNETLLSQHLAGRQEQEYDRVLKLFEKEKKRVDLEIKKQTKKTLTGKQIDELNDLKKESKKLETIISTKDTSAIKSHILGELTEAP